MSFAANPIAQQERVWWDAHTDFECVWGADGDGVAECLRLVEHGLALRCGVSLQPIVVDLGCGPGRLLGPFAAAHPDVEVVGVDVSRRMLDLVPSPGPNVSLVHGDGRSIPLASGLAVGVYSVLVFQHIPVPGQFAYLADVARVLRSGGRFVVQVVRGKDDGSFLSHASDVDEMFQAGREANLDLVDHVVGAVFDEWSWLTFEKRA